MKKNIMKFFEEKRPILWIKPDNFEEVLELIKESLIPNEKNRIFVYEDKKLIDFKEKVDVEGINSLFLALDELYPQGIRKVPIYLILKNSIEEILKKNNLEYIEEIIENKMDNPNYNFTLIVLENEEVPNKLEKNTYVIDEKVLKSQVDLKKYIEYKLKEQNKTLDEKNLQEFSEFLKAKIISILKKKESSIDKDMIYVEKGLYKPKFSKEDIELDDIEVYKYPVTQELWNEIMGTNPSYYQGALRPVENIKWIDALYFCNKLSELNGLEPVYLIEEGEYKGLFLKNIRYLNGELVDPDEADFSKTEGYRLPLEVEWEWFAAGGKIAMNEGTFFNNNKHNCKIRRDSQADYLKETYAVGKYNPNELGIYDCCGNVYEWCYDKGSILDVYGNLFKEEKESYITNSKKYIYVKDEGIFGLGEYRVVKGCDDIDNCPNFGEHSYTQKKVFARNTWARAGVDRYHYSNFNEINTNSGFLGFRFVRTV